MIAFPTWRLVSFFLFAIFLHVSANRAYKVIPIVTKVLLKDNLNYLNSSVQTYDASENKIDFSISLKTPLVDPWINIIVWIDVASGALKAPLQNGTFNFCKFLRNPPMHRLAQILLNEVKRSGDAPKKCPFLPKLYEFRGVSTGALRLPLFFPESDFIMALSVGVKNDMAYDSRWYGTLKRIQCRSNRRC